MNQSRLRVYFGPDNEERSPVARPQPTRCDTVTLSAGELFGLLEQAVREKRAWLEDFSDDEITLSTDLYEVLLAFEHFRRPSA